MKIIMKDSWDDITISDYKQIQQGVNNVKLLSILTNLSESDVRDLDVKALTALISEISWAKEQVDEDQRDPLIYHSVDGYFYKLNKNIDKWNAGRYLDVLEVCKDQQSVMDNIHLVYALACDKYVRTRAWYGGPVMKEIEYDDRNILEDAEQVKANASIAQALSTVSFFLAISKSSTTLTPAFLVEQMKKALKRGSMKE